MITVPYPIEMPSTGDRDDAPGKDGAIDCETSRSGPITACSLVSPCLSHQQDRTHRDGVLVNLSAN